MTLHYDPDEGGAFYLPAAVVDGAVMMRATEVAALLLEVATVAECHGAAAVRVVADYVVGGILHACDELTP